MALFSVGDRLRKFVFAAVVAVVGLASNAANAITFNFDAIDADTRSASSYNMSVGGLDLAISAGSFQAGGNIAVGGGERVTLNGANPGLGVNGIGADSRKADGGGLWKDSLIFGFSKNVVVESIEFSLFRSRHGLSNFQLFSGGGLVALGGAVGIPVDGAYNFFGDLMGQLFGIGAPGDWDRFKIRSITVSEVSPVPLPAALPLLGGALLVLGVAKRRRKAA